MTNTTLAVEATLPSSGLLSSKLIATTDKAVPATHARKLGRSEKGERRNRSLLGELLDPKSSSVSLTALARVAAFSGKRLIIEIRDENPVRIVRA